MSNEEVRAIKAQFSGEIDRFARSNLGTPESFQANVMFHLGVLSSIMTRTLTYLEERDAR